MPANPLDLPGTPFELEMCNPNPSSSKTKEGPKYRVSFEVTRDIWDLFMSADTSGMIVLARATVYAGQEEERSLVIATKGEYGEEAKVLRQSGFFRMPAVWAVVGTDAQFLDWLKTQKCAYGRTNRGRNAQDCTGQLVPAHVRRVSEGSGTGIKPPYAAIPLCHHHHSLQHNEGESAVGGRTWFEQQRIYWLEQWCWYVIKADFEVDSFTKIAPMALYSWADRNGVAEHLPKIYQMDKDKKL